MISSGQMRWGDMSESEQLAIHKLEVQAGLPVGFTSRIKIPEGSKIQSVTQRTDPSGNVIADIIYVDPYTGAVSVKHQTLGKTKVASSGGGGSTSSSAKRYYRCCSTDRSNDTRGSERQLCISNRLECYEVITFKQEVVVQQIRRGAPVQHTIGIK